MLKKITTKFAAVAIAATALIAVAATGDAFAQSLPGGFVRPQGGPFGRLGPPLAPGQLPQGAGLGLVRPPVGSLANPAQARAFPSPAPVVRSSRPFLGVGLVKPPVGSLANPAQARAF